MIIVYMILGVVIFVVLIKVLGGKIENNEISDRGGMKAIYSEYFNCFQSNIFDINYEGFGFDEINGALARYHIYFPEYELQINFESNIIKGVMFTKYKIYKPERSGMNLRYSSPKYSFENAEYKQEAMYESIIQRAITDLFR
jgi:hypothetical protein